MRCFTKPTLAAAVLWLSATAAMCAAVILSGCTSGTSADRMLLFVSGDTRNYLEPCGCRVDQAGGLGARMTLVTNNPKTPRILVDVGNLTSGGRRWELLKLEWLLKGMQTMGYDAVNLGAKEVDLEAATLQKIVRAEKVPFVSCNVLNRETGQRIAPAHRSVERAGIRVAVTGVVEVSEEGADPGIIVRRPEEALAEVLPDLRRSHDMVVVLAFCTAERMRSIARRFHEADLVLGGDVPQSSGEAEVVNRAALFSVTDHGKVLGRLYFKRDNGRMVLSNAIGQKVSDKITAAPEMTALMKQYREALRAESIQASSEEGLEQIGANASTADRYMGDRACTPCHAQAHAVTSASAHARAYETLVAKGAEFDPECLRCHTVGYGARDGFRNLQTTPHLKGVGCESCHGRGGDHIRMAQAARPSRGTLAAVTPGSCVKCHDRENSLHFDYRTYWPRIAHRADQR
jgi:hypothetical protein